MTASVIELFAQVLRPDQIITRENTPERYQSDWTYTNPQAPLFVLLPESTDEVSQILKICHTHHQAIVTQGGTTGLAGSATPGADEVSLSLERMTGVESIDEVGLSIRALAGTTLGDVHRALEYTNYIYGVDYGARDMAQIGGNISTNAGGTQVVRYGMTRAQVLGLEAVLADGTILSSMNTLLKNNAGYDLKQLFVGTEGTLGVITRAQLRIFPRPSSCCTALFALEDYESCLMLLRLCRGIFAETLTGFEVMWKPYFEAACDAAETHPFETEKSDKLYALVEIRGQSQQNDRVRFEELFRQCQQEDIVKNGALAESEEDAADLWAIRFAVKHLLKSAGRIAHFDIGIPTADIQAYVDLVTETLTQEFPNVTIYAFGHIADGNVHVLVDTGNADDVAQVDELVYPLCEPFQGTITAEHGVGMLKKAQLLKNRSAEELKLMRTIKRTLDPNNILNPGRVFDLD